MRRAVWAGRWEAEAPPAGPPGLWNAEKLMRLQAEPPARMRQAVLERGPRVPLPVGPVHRLQKEMTEGQRLEPFRLGPDLRVDQLQLVSGPQQQLRPRFGAHADPVQPGGRKPSAVRLHRDLETFRVQRGHDRGIQLKE